MKLPPSITNFARVFKDKGYELYLVGGAVRNFILGIEPKDYDFATNAQPQTVQSLFKRVIPTGIKHGTVTVLFEGFSFEVTTYRIDGQYTDKRKPDEVVFTSNLVEDLSRRDFTINSMAYSVLEDLLVDPFGGQPDLQKKVIRTVGDPNKRFNEDALRILRAIRFACQLNGEIESATWSAVKNLHQSLQFISRERLRDEFLKILLSKHADFGLGLLFESQITKVLCSTQDLDNSFDSDYFKRILSLPSEDPVSRLSYFCLFFESALEPETFLKSLKLTNSQITNTKKIIEIVKTFHSRELSDYQLRSILSLTDYQLYPSCLLVLSTYSQAGSRAMDDAFIANYHRGLEIAQTRPPCNIADLAIDGNYLINILQVPKSRLIGEILDFLLDEVLKNPKLNEISNLSSLAQSFIKDATKQ